MGRVGEASCHGLRSSFLLVAPSLHAAASRSIARDARRFASRPHPPAYVTVSTRFWAESAAPVDLRRPVPAPPADDRVLLAFENGVVPGAGGDRAAARGRRGGHPR